MGPIQVAELPLTCKMTQIQETPVLDVFSSGSSCIVPPQRESKHIIIYTKLVQNISEKNIKVTVPPIGT